MFRKLSLYKKIRAGFVASLLLLMAVSVLSVWSMFALNKNTLLVEHTHNVLLKLEETLSLMKDAESAASWYIFTENKTFLTPYFNCLNNIDSSIAQLKDLVKENKLQTERIVALETLCKQRLEVLKVILTYQYLHQTEKVVQIIKEGTGKMLMDRLRYKASEMRAEENYLLLDRKKNTRIAETYTYVIIAFGNLLAIIISTFAMYNINKELDQRLRAESDLKEKQDNLEKLNLELEAFSYTISHDLRSPLRAIAGFSQILEDDYTKELDDEGIRILKIVKNNAAKMGALIDDLLDFSKLNRKTFDSSIVYMEELITEVLEEIKLNFPLMSPEIIINAMPPALGDRALLRQVWINLISNAFKYSSLKDNPKIEIGYKKEEETFYYYVKDNGAGFDEAYKDKLFGVFQRLHSIKDFEGNGVGLAIVQRIIHRHGGDILAEGKINDGAMFKFTIPIADNRR